jgi:hypothetical protein
MNDFVPIATLREQMGQLTALHTAGALGDAQYHEARLALEKRIVDAVINGPADSTPATNASPQAATATGKGWRCVASPRSATSCWARRKP